MGAGLGGGLIIDRILQGGEAVVAGMFNTSNALIAKVGLFGNELAEVIGDTRRAGINLTEALRGQMADMYQLPTQYYADFTQLTNAVRAAGQQFVALQEGLEFSARGVSVFAVELNRGFGAPFQLTKQALDALIVTGMSTSEQFEEFRRSTGRAGLTSDQFTQIVSKNSLAFMIFGNSIAKGIADLESLGVQTQQLIGIQKGIIGNMEGTLDTVNQLNMLGARIDPTELFRLAELGDPVQTFIYVMKSIPEEMLKSGTSIRSLVSQISGIDPEMLLRAADARAQTAADIQTIMTQARGYSQTFTSTIAEEGYKAIGLFSESMMGVAAKMAAEYESSLGTMAGYSIAQEALNLAATPNAPMRTPKPAQDLLSGGGPNRILSTPDGDYELATNDTVVAGTRLFPEASLQVGDTGGTTEIDIERLSSKIEALIATLSSANTVIEINNGVPQQVPRMSLSAIYTRNERG